MRSEKTGPIFRWAGSKRKLLGRLERFWSDRRARYIEPFAGSAALFFRIRPAKAVLNDLNPDLIQTYRTIQAAPMDVYDRARSFPATREAYLTLRAQDVRKLSARDRAARFMFLNRYCFNGLYRTNTRGEFNVPFASSRTGEFPDPDEYKTAVATLSVAELRCMDFEALIESVVRHGDFVYLDPPYAVTGRRVFRDYGPLPFGQTDLERLASTLKLIHSRGATFVLSYAWSREAKQHFSGWQTTRVQVQRHIAGFAEHRRSAIELLVSNTSPA